MSKNNVKLIGMIHLLPTMGYDDWPGMDAMFDKAKKDLLALEEGGADAALIENDADLPCQVKGEPDVVVPMTKVACELVKIAKIPLGVEALLNDPKASLAIAKTCSLGFIRTDYFVDRMERGGYGEFEIDPKGLMAFKKHITADDIKVYADVQVKYARMIDEKTIAESVGQAIKEGADGVVISGNYTGVRPDLSDVKEAKLATKGKVPVIIGSGFSVANAKSLLKHADWAIFGNSVKIKGFVDAKKVAQLVKVVKGK